MKHVFGPVPSRRLGLSLGVDLVEPKTCTHDCLYCECGPTTRLLARPEPLIPAEVVLDEVAQVLAEEKRRLDYITLSGSGEPTLNSEMGRVLTGLKDLAGQTPVAVITNSSLLHRPEVMAALEPADLIMPSLDTVVEATFRRLNRPHPQISLADMIEGLYGLKAALKAEIWLEMLFVAGINDSPEELEGLRRAVERIEPERIQINTVDRPPADRRAGPLSRERLLELAELFGPRAEVIASPPTDFRPGQGRELTETVLDLIDRRPCTRSDLRIALGCSEAELAASLKVLLMKRRIREEVVAERVYLRGVPQED